MAEYDKMTVANLRVLLKDRGIPSTGLSRKAQIVAKLQEEDAAAAAANEPAEQPQEVLKEPDEKQQQQQQQPEEPAAAAIEPQQPSPPAKLDVDASKDEAAIVEEKPVSEDRTEGAPQAPDPRTSLPPNDSPEVPSPQISSSQTPLPSKEKISRQSTADVANPIAPVADLTRSNTAGSQIGSEVEDRRKRKRRSASPPLDTQDVVAKKQKQAVNGGSHQEQSGADTGVAEIQDTVMEDSRPDGESVPIALEEVGQVEKPEDAPVSAQDEESPKKTAPSEVVRPQREPKYSSLLPPGPEAIEVPKRVAAEDLPTPPPPRHPVTRALYIRNFTRPLQLNALRQHLVALTGLQEDDSIDVLHVDPIKTHAFVVVKNTAAAERIRAGTHQQLWPKERDRKLLWTDYIPEQQVRGWIDIEQNPGSSSRIARWEVVYTVNNGETVANHREAGDTLHATDDEREERPSAGLNLQRPSQNIEAVPPKPAQPREAARPFVALDQLFESTKTKPMLYYLPATDEVADLRWNALDDKTVKGWSPAELKEEPDLLRISFEHDNIVSNGPHYEPGTRKRVQEAAGASGPGVFSQRPSRGNDRRRYPRH